MLILFARPSTHRFVLFPLTLALAGCSSGSGSGESASGSPDASRDTSTSDVTAADATGQDTSTTAEASSGDTGVTDAGIADASDGSCPAAWFTPPDVDPSIAVPADGGGVLVHGAGVGTQNYVCTVTDGGTTWTFVTPHATLEDCNGLVVAMHFASEAGSAYPEWQAPDGTYVVGHKVASFTPDGGADSVPWLLLEAVDHGGTGPLSQVAYVQRLDTDGGAAPSGSCEAGATADVPYTADYYFYGP
jgi:hypothetical protein